MEPTHSSPDELSSETIAPNPRGEWLFPLLLLVVLLGAAVYAANNRQSAEAPGNNAALAWTPAEQPTGETVRLVIDFGNGATRSFAALPWREDMTVADMLAAAAEFRPAIEFTQTGSGEATFLTSLEAVANEGGKGRNWRYLVNERLGETSFGIAPLQPGDSVLWEFTAEY